MSKLRKLRVILAAGGPSCGVLAGVMEFPVFCVYTYRSPRGTEFRKFHSARKIQYSPTLDALDLERRGVT